MAVPSPMETKYVHRVLLVAFAFSVLFAVICGKLFLLQHVWHGHYREKAIAQQIRTLEIKPLRGSIYSADGHPLATSSFRDSAYLAPADMVFPEEDPRFARRFARELAHCLWDEELDYDAIEEKARFYQRKMLAQRRVTLSGEGADGTAVRLRGTLSDGGECVLEGKAGAMSLRLSGEMVAGMPVVLRGETAKGRKVVLRGEASPQLRFELRGNPGIGETVTLNVHVYRKLDFPLKRQLEDESVPALVALRNEFGLAKHALYFVKEGTRSYPKGSLASHVVGCTSSDSYGDNKGQAGAELVYSEELNGSPKKEKLEVTGFGQSISPLGDTALADAMGNNVYLTINEAIQHYAEEALARQVHACRARGGVCVAMEVKTGAVLAMASWPTFDPNDPPRNASAPGFRNRCLVDSIEPGSVMKIFTATALLEHNRMSPHEIIDCENGSCLFDVGTRQGRRITDSHQIGKVPVIRAFAESSNIGFVKLGLRLRKNEFHGELTRLGFGRKTGIDLPGEGTGRVYPVSKWNQFSRTSVPFGYELLLTPIQVTAAVAGIVNGGCYMQPHVLREVRSPRNEILRRYEPKCVRRVCSPETSQIILSMMEEVVLDGTGDNAYIPGYRVGGKTGTTLRTDPPRPGQDPETKRYYASFVGVLPVENPEIVVYSWIDEPQGEKFGGTVAAPVFRTVAEHATRILGIEPSYEEPPRRLVAETGTTRDVGGEHETKFSFALPISLPDFGPDGAMPDLRGLTVIEVAERLRKARVDAQLLGWGVASRQQPLPGEEIPRRSRALVIFENPNPVETPVPPAQNEVDEPWGGGA